MCKNGGECKRERERQRERQRGREGREIHVLLVHSILLSLLFFYFFSLLYVQYTYSAFVTKNDIISSNAHRSVVRMTQVFDLEKCSILKTLLRDFKRENDLILCYNGFLIH